MSRHQVNRHPDFIVFIAKISNNEGLKRFLFCLKLSRLAFTREIKRTSLCPLTKWWFVTFGSVKLVDIHRAAPAPAAFTSSALSISPTEVEIGVSVTISVLVANTGDLAGSYEVTLEIDSVAVATDGVDLAGGDSQPVTFSVARDVAGTYTVDIGGLSGTFTVKTPPTPATFTTGALAISPSTLPIAPSDLSISPDEVETGESVTISVLVTNDGDLAGSYEVTLKINNVAVASEDIDLAGGDSQQVTFITTKDVAGTYTVNVDGLSGTFTVKTPPAKPINWWLIGSIIAGCVVVGLLVYFFVWRKRGVPEPS